MIYIEFSRIKNLEFFTLDGRELRSGRPDKILFDWKEFILSSVFCFVFLAMKKMKIPLI